MSKKKKNRKRTQSIPSIDTSDINQVSENVKESVQQSMIIKWIDNESYSLFAGILFACILLVFGGFWFTDSVFMFKDIGSDSVNVFYTSYYWVADYFEKYGSIPTWSMASGLGQSIFFGSYGDPFLWIYYIIGKEAIPETIAYIEAIKFFLAGSLFFAFLRKTGLSYVAAIAGGLIYTFSGFMAIGATWFVFSIQALYFALYFLAFEYLIQDRKPWLYILTIFLIAIQLPLDIFYVALMTMIYGLGRLVLFYDADLKRILSDLFQMVLYGAIAVLMAMFMMLPTLHTMLNSPRVLGESSFFDSLQSVSWFQMLDPALWQTTLSRWLNSDLLKATDYSFMGAMNYLEAPAIYCGVLSVFFMVVFFAMSERREKIWLGSLCLLIAIPMIFPFFRYAFWLFSGDYYRLYSLFIIIVFLLIMIRGFDLWFHSGKANWRVFLFGLGVFTILLYWVYSFDLVTVNKAQFHKTLLFGIAQLVVVGMVLIGQRNVSKWLFICLLSMELISHTRSVFYERILATNAEFNSQKVGYNDYTKDAVAYLASTDSSFYRLEKNYPSYNKNLIMHTSTNDAKVQGYYGTKSYYSFNNIHYVRFLGAMDIIDPTNESATRWLTGLGGRPLVNFVMGNKYFLTKSDPNQNLGFGYRFLNQINDVSIFTQDNHLPLGFVYPKMISIADFNHLDSRRINNIISKKDISLLKAVIIEDQDLEDQILPVLDTSTFMAVNYPFAELQSDVQTLRENTFQITSFRDDYIQGRITNQVEGGILFFSIPFDEGWAARVNGMEANIMKVNVGFMGLALGQGDYEIELIYTPPYIWTGFYLSLMGVFLLILIIIFRDKLMITFDKKE